MSAATDRAAVESAYAAFSAARDTYEAAERAFVKNRQDAVNAHRDASRAAHAPHATDEDRAAFLAAQAVMREYVPTTF